MSAGLQGSVSQDGVCITGGTFGPTGAAAWLKISGSYQLSADICFTLDADGTKLDGVTSGQLLTSTGQPVPLVTLKNLGTISLGFTFSQTSGGATLTMLSTLDNPSSSQASALLQGTIAANGDLTATLSTANLTLFGVPADLSGTISRLSGVLSYSASATLAGPLSPPGAPGISLTGITAKLENTGLQVNATGALGPASNQLSVAVQVTVADVNKWNAAVTTSGATWQPIQGLSVNTGFTGTLTYDFTATPTYAYDFTFTDNPAVSWSNGSGANVAVTTVQLSSTATCAQATSGDPILTVAGTASISSLSAKLTGCADLATTSFSLQGQTTTALTFGVVSIPVLTMTLAGANGTATFTGNATGTLTVGATSDPFTVTVDASSGTKGQLVVAGSIDLSGFGLPTGAADGFVAYASGPVTAYPTGFAAPAPSSVDLASGVTAFGYVSLSSSVLGDLQSLGDTQDTALTFTAALSSSAVSFTTTLNVPSLKLFTLTLTNLVATASYTRAGGVNTLAFSVTADVPSESGTATLDVGLAYDSSSNLTGTASLTNLSVFGQALTLTGSISRGSSGALTGSITLKPITIALPLPGSVTVTVQNFTATLATGAGLSLSGTVSVPGTTSGLALAGAFSSLRNYTVSVSGTLNGWTPTSGVTIGQAALAGSIASATTPATGTTPANTATTLDLKATGTLFSIAPVSAVSMSVTSVELSNGPVSGGCTVATVGDLWLGVTGSLSVTLGHTGTADAVGCFDITADDLSLSVSVPLNYSTLGNTLTLVDPQVTVTKTTVNGTGVYAATAQAKLTVSFKTPFTITAAVQFKSGDDFVVGAGINLSQYLPGTGAVGNAYLIYTTAAVNNFDSTAFGGFGSINLGAGINIAGQVQVPSDFGAALAKAHLTQPGSDSLVAVGNLNLATGTATLSIAVDLGVHGQDMFNTNGSQVALTSGDLQLTIAPTLVAFGVRVNATLTMTSPTSDACNQTSNTVNLTGLIQLTDTDLVASLGVSGWQDALGICGLDIAQFTAQVGIGLEDGIPTLGFSVGVTGLPQKLASAIGYVQNTPLSLALNLSPDEFLVSMSIGTAGQTTPALQPLAAFGKPNLIVVDYAQLYISPDGATIGTTTYPAGYALALTSTIDGVALDLSIQVNPTTPSLAVNAQLGQIQAGSLTFGPTTVILDASPTTFQFELDGSINLGPGTLDLGLVEFTGQLSAGVKLSIGTDGLAAQITGSASIQGSNYLPQSVCYYKHVVPYPCNFQWINDKKLTIPPFTAGIDVNSSGVDVQIPYTSKTLHLPFSSNHGGGVSSATPPAASGNGSQMDGLRSSGAAIRAAAVAAAQPSDSPTPPPTGASGALHRVFAHDDAVPPPARALPLTAPAPQIKAAVGYPGYVIGEIRPGITASAVSDDSQAAGGASWQPVPAMSQSRTFAVTAALPDDSVLVAGGTDGTSILTTAEVYHPTSSTWTGTGSMHQARAGAAVTVLADGRVLVAGGSDQTDELTSSEIYSPATGTFSPTGSLHVGRQLATAVRLADGRVLVAGGRGPGDQPLASAEIFDPSTGRWTVVAPLAQARMYAASTLLPSGRVLVTSGLNASGPMNSSELFDPAAGHWSATGSIANARYGAAATTLADGQVLLSGGSAFAEMYNSITGVWARSGTEYSPRTFSGTVTLSDGRVLTAGGVSGGSVTTDTEVFNPQLQLWGISHPLPVPGFGVHAAALPDGHALLAGGQIGPTAHADSFVYIPGSNSGGGGGGGGGGGDLPNTGASVPVVPATVLGLLLLLLGGALVFAASGLRRRRS